MSNTTRCKPWDPHLTVATIVPEPVTESDNKANGFSGQRFLFVEEQINNDIITNQPAGHLEPHESLLDAAVRETLEETGWHVELTHFIGVYVYRPKSQEPPAPSSLAPSTSEGHDPETASNSDAGATYYRFCFCAKPINLISNVELDHGIIRPLWLSVDELNAKERVLRSPLVKQCVIDYQAGRRYPLSTVSEWIE